MRAFSTQRPVDIGTYPKDRYEIKEIKNFDKRIYCPEIGRKAWGYIDYEGYLPRKALDDYELVAQEYQVHDTWKKLVDIYELTRDRKPDDTIKGLLKAKKPALVENMFAVYASVRDHDGRLSLRNKDFFKNIAAICEDSVKWESGNPVVRMGFDDIHPAHIDQQMEAYRKMKEAGEI